jgi:uncharacterized membrane protein YdjX (TVP38/TMEM64 family)
MSGVTAWVSNNRRSVFAVLVWLIILGGVWVGAQMNGISVGGLMDSLAGLLRDTPYGVSLYLFAFTLRPITLVPSWTFSVVGGTLWGGWPGILYVMVGGVLSGVLPYHVGRAFKRNPPINPTATSVFQRLMHSAHENPFQAVLLTRLLQLPYDFVNLALGGMGIPIVPYYGATIVGNLLGSLPYVLLGASFVGNFSSGTFTVDYGVVALSAATMLLSLGVSWWLRRRTVKT